jgi:hypothetical protein
MQNVPTERTLQLRADERARVVDTRPANTTRAYGNDSEGAASDVGSFLARERRPPWTRGRGSRANLARWLLEAGEQHDVVMAVCGMARSPFHEYTTRRVSAVGAKIAPRPAEAISLHAAIARAEAALAAGSLPSESERMRRADEASEPARSAGENFSTAWLARAIPRVKSPTCRRFATPLGA